MFVPPIEKPYYCGVLYYVADPAGTMVTNLISEMAGCFPYVSMQKPYVCNETLYV